MRRGNPDHDEHLGEKIKCPTVDLLQPEKPNPLHVKQESEMQYVKQEAEPETTIIKEEEQEHEIAQFPITASVKSDENEGPNEESGAAKPSSDSSFQHVTTKGGGQSQPDGLLLAPLSDSDDVTSHSSDFDTDEEDNDFDQNASKSLYKSLMKMWLGNLFPAHIVIKYFLGSLI
ncbi:uncharacterized protein LOC130925823 isoform X4 [Corythoichthys intestinalis]|uniref:uncharacterized protein LOC130925823 isoform X4 n=1 Tax=Corythoichthys intestinalis TaxID=161448 RepID=UPI0025A60B2C|nr:uncharacterized protein LOC130925823 isoform X4 [Corythoichthys intestinalis]